MSSIGALETYKNATAMSLRKRTTNPKTFEVRKILQKKMTGKRILYKVIFGNSTSEYISWEPIKNLKLCSSIIEEFESGKTKLKKAQKMKSTKISKLLPPSQSSPVSLNHKQVYDSVQNAEEISSETRFTSSSSVIPLTLPGPSEGTSNVEALPRSHFSSTRVISPVLSKSLAGIQIVEATNQPRLASSPPNTSPSLPESLNRTVKSLASFQLKYRAPARVILSPLSVSSSYSQNIDLITDPVGDVTYKWTKKYKKINDYKSEIKNLTDRDSSKNAQIKNSDQLKRCESEETIYRPSNIEKKRAQKTREEDKSFKKVKIEFTCENWKPMGVIAVTDECFNLHGGVEYFVEYENIITGETKKELLSNTKARREIPDLIIKFYETHTRWI